MKYRHQFHAGNFADVHKHVALLEVLSALKRKDKGFLFVDTHAGRGEYDLHPSAPGERPHEWQNGVGKLLAREVVSPALRLYRELVSQGVMGQALRYRGSPLLAAQSLRAVDRAVFFETQRDEAGALRRVLETAARSRVESADGFAGLRALLPPPERRGCVLIDPPYEEREDYPRVQQAALDALERFAGAVLLLWLPIKLRADFDQWLSTLVRGCGAPVTASLVWMHPCDSRAALNGSAMVIVNPPWQIEESMRGWLPELRTLLGGPQSGYEISVPRATD